MIDHYAVINRRYAISISHKERLRSVGLDNIKRMAEATAMVAFSPATMAQPSCGTLVFSWFPTKSNERTVHRGTRAYLINHRPQQMLKHHVGRNH